MARGPQTKAERRQSRADGPTKAQRIQARAARKRRAPGVSPEPTPAGNGTPEENIEWRLARIEEAVASQSERNEELLNRVTLANEAMRAGERSPASVLRASMDEETTAELERALSLRRESMLPVREPLALICQAQRSGGTLLARLFDGHPQCHAHPHELHIGDKRPHVWPELRLDEEPKAWFAKLEEEKLIDLFRKGRRKIPLKVPGEGADEGRYPLILLPAFQRLLFIEEVERRSPIASEREILDCYMTSLFNAWLDNQNLRGAEKRWVVAFSPRRAWGDRLDKLFELYPDGRLISILRDPLSWYASAQGRDPQADPDGLLELWKRSAGEMLEAKRRFEERFRIVRFEELVMDTPATMRGLADFLGIDFDPVLTTPTFNGYAVGANSSYEVRDTGVVTDPVDRYKAVLSSEQQKLVRGECEELHREVLALVEDQAAPPGEGASSGALKRSAASRSEPKPDDAASKSKSAPKRGTSSKRTAKRGEASTSAAKRSGASTSAAKRSGASKSAPKRGGAAKSAPKRGGSSKSAPQRAGSKSSPSKRGEASTGKKS